MTLCYWQLGLRLVVCALLPGVFDQIDISGEVGRKNPSKEGPEAGIIKYFDQNHNHHHHHHYHQYHQYNHLWSQLNAITLIKLAVTDPTLSSQVIIQRRTVHGISLQNLDTSTRL